MWSALAWACRYSEYLHAHKDGEYDTHHPCPNILKIEGNSKDLSQFVLGRQYKKTTFADLIDLGSTQT
jgi:hypothetical protein